MCWESWQKCCFISFSVQRINEFTEMKISKNDVVQTLCCFAFWAIMHGKKKAFRRATHQFYTQRLSSPIRSISRAVKANLLWFKRNFIEKKNKKNWVTVDVVWVFSTLARALKFNKKPVLQAGGMAFKRRKHLRCKCSLMEGDFLLHYGKWIKG